MGEVKDHKWQFHLSRHSNTGPDIDATSTQYSRDNFGERISNSSNYWESRVPGLTNSIINRMSHDHRRSRLKLEWKIVTPNVLTWGN